MKGPFTARAQSILLLAHVEHTAAVGAAWGRSRRGYSAGSPPAPLLGLPPALLSLFFTLFTLFTLFALFALFGLLLYDIYARFSGQGPEKL